MSNIQSGLVSTIIPVFNRKDRVGIAVNTVLSQTYRPIEILLVNDGSTDGSGEYLENLAKQNPDKIKVIHRENGGAGLARESGREVAQGEYIQYLDSDDWLFPNKFKDQVTTLKQNPECDICYGITRAVDDEGLVLEEPSKKTGQSFEYLFPQLLVDRWWNTSTPLYSRRISDLAGAWQKRRPEDWELEARMGAYRPKLVSCHTLVSCHVHHFSPGRVSHGDETQYLKDEAWFLPRLFENAIRAGVDINAVEMNHFARAAFLRARQLGKLGESSLADELIALSERAGLASSKQMKVVKAFSKLLGWKTTGRICALLDKLKNAF